MTLDTRTQLRYPLQHTAPHLHTVLILFLDGLRPSAESEVRSIEPATQINTNHEVLKDRLKSTLDCTSSSLNCAIGPTSPTQAYRNQKETYGALDNSAVPTVSVTSRLLNSFSEISM